MPIRRVDERRHRIICWLKIGVPFVLVEGKAGFILNKPPAIFYAGLFQGEMAELLGRHFKSSKVT